ncbi:MAG: hypothetical protein ACKO2Z_04480, partial [Sphaerospermopsis kisseleviana]
SPTSLKNRGSIIYFTFNYSRRQQAGGRRQEVKHPCGLGFACSVCTSWMCNLLYVDVIKNKKLKNTY